eukprot:Clim_evm23s243 gene=Clim_evmTU23s243
MSKAGKVAPIRIDPRSRTITSRLTELLGVQHPIMCAGMAGVTLSDLTAAVSEAGGFGCMGAAQYDPQELDAELTKTRAKTQKPIGIDILVPSSRPGDLAPYVEIMAKHKVKAFVAGLGVPRRDIEHMKSKGILVGTVCGRVRHAIKAVDAGCDFVIMQGTEGGGHTGTTPLLPLLHQAILAVGDKVPVVAAGSIVDGMTFASVLAMGADGIWCGTRFVATPEAVTAKGFKKRVVDLSIDDTVITKFYTGKTCRVQRNKYTTQMENSGEKPLPFPDMAIKTMELGINHLNYGQDEPNIDVDREFFPSGMGIGAIHDIRPAADIVRMYVEEAVACLSRTQYTVSSTL